jgi:crotonobetainyl-CoA:carnitine CoA-transferase CaiB-like acyl-CoA transferase
MQMTDHSVTADSLLPVAATGPLAGVRVLDLVSVVMGPYATQILGDLGAEVISLEVAGGDPLRVIGRGVHPQLSGAALNVLRNKRNASINLKSPEGHEAFMRLAASCDVFVTNLRPQALEKLGLGYAAVAAAKPDIIYCEAHGFSSDGPRSQEAAYDDIIQASSGIVDLMGSVRERPALAPMILADKLSGLTIVYAVTAALYCRAKTGQGQRIEVPMHDAVASFVLVEHGADAIVQPPQGDPGYQRLLAPNHRPYTTADGGVLVVIPYSPKNWLDLFAAGGRTTAEDDPRLASHGGMAANYDALYVDLSDIIASRTTEFWLAWGPAHSVAMSPIRTLSELVDELPEATHPISGPHKVIPPPVRFYTTPQNIRRHAPLMGENTVELLLRRWATPTKKSTNSRQTGRFTPSGASVYESAHGPCLYRRDRRERILPGTRFGDE